MFALLMELGDGGGGGRVEGGFVGVVVFERLLLSWACIS